MIWWTGLAPWEFEFPVPSPAFRVQILGFGIKGLGSGAQGSGFRVQGSGFRVQGSGLKVQGLWFSSFRVQGVGFSAQPLASCVSVLSSCSESSGWSLVPSSVRRPSSPGPAARTQS